MKQITTNERANHVEDIDQTWKVVAIQRGRSLSWTWCFPMDDQMIYREMLKDGTITSVQRREPEQTVLLAKRAAERVRRY